MPSYRVLGLTLASDCEFPELPAVTASAPPDCWLSVENAAGLDAAGEPVHRWILPDGTAFLEIGALASGYLLRFAKLTDVVVTADRRHVRAFPLPGVPNATVRHLILNQVLPLLVGAGGSTVLHASAVEVAGRAVAFLGQSGAGKSTLCASLVALGCSLVTDDGLRLEVQDGVVQVVPSYPGLRLWDDSKAAVLVDAAVSAGAHYNAKRRIDAAAAELPFAASPVPLCGAYVVDPAEAEQSGVRVERIPPRSAFLEAVRFAFKLDPRNEAALRDEFRRVDQLVRAVPFFRLTYPRDFARLPDVRDAVHAHAGALAQR